MSDEEQSRSCPECGQEAEENPVFDLWMCDNCELSFNADDEVVAR